MTFREWFATSPLASWLRVFGAVILSAAVADWSTSHHDNSKHPNLLYYLSVLFALCYTFYLLLKLLMQFHLIQFLILKN